MPSSEPFAIRTGPDKHMVEIPAQMVNMRQTGEKRAIRVARGTRRPGIGQRAEVMANMDVTTRIESAMERIRANATAMAGDGGGSDSERLRELMRRNEALEGELQDLRVQRDNDLAELDGLVAQLKPLIGEG